MPKQKLVCTVELDLPDDALAASKAQTSLLEIWTQFKGAVSEDEALSGAKLSQHIVKSKAAPAKKIEKEPEPSAQSTSGQVASVPFNRR